MRGVGGKIILGNNGKFQQGDSFYSSYRFNLIKDSVERSAINEISLKSRSGLWSGSDDYPNRKFQEEDFKFSDNLLNQAFRSRYIQQAVYQHLRYSDSLNYNTNLAALNKNVTRYSAIVSLDDRLTVKMPTLKQIKINKVYEFITQYSENYWADSVGNQASVSGVEELDDLFTKITKVLEIFEIIFSDYEIFDYFKTIGGNFARFPNFINSKSEALKYLQDIENSCFDGKSTVPPFTVEKSVLMFFLDHACNEINRHIALYNIKQPELETGRLGKFSNKFHKNYSDFMFKNSFPPDFKELRLDPKDYVIQPQAIAIYSVEKLSEYANSMRLLEALLVSEQSNLSDYKYASPRIIKHLPSGRIISNSDFVVNPRGFFKFSLVSLRVDVKDFVLINNKVDNKEDLQIKVSLLDMDKLKKKIVNVLLLDFKKSNIENLKFNKDEFLSVAISGTIAEKLDLEDYFKRKQFLISLIKQLKSEKFFKDLSVSEVDKIYDNIRQLDDSDNVSKNTPSRVIAHPKFSTYLQLNSSLQNLKGMFVGFHGNQNSSIFGISFLKNKTAVYRVVDDGIVKILPNSSFYKSSNLADILNRENFSSSDVIIEEDNDSQ